MIETILLCLESVTKGTIYRVGPMPELRAVRITSGIREQSRIRWGLPEQSDYNYPGKVWEQYRDRPGYALEAMGWCVERQKSWTADNPYEDLRSVRKQLHGEVEDFHHMEPVLVRKDEMAALGRPLREYPIDWLGNPIWQDTDYIVAAVIKIHFMPHTVHRGDRNTKIIKHLAYTLGTELLSLHVRETAAEAHKELARQRLDSCNDLAHEFRNVLTKFGLVISAINAEVSYLREQWEGLLARTVPGVQGKAEILSGLNEVLQGAMNRMDPHGEAALIARGLFEDQRELAALSPLPRQSERWLNDRIAPKWERLLSETGVLPAEREAVTDLLSRLRRAFWMGLDEDLAARVPGIPEDLRRAWPHAVYMEPSAGRGRRLDEVLRLLDHPALDIPHKRQMKKVVASLKAVVESIPEVEERGTRIMDSLKTGELDHAAFHAAARPPVCS